MDNNILIEALKTSLRTLNEIPNKKLGSSEFKDSYSVCSYIEKILDKAERKEHEYTITWTIDFYATSPEEAARRALETQRDKSSVAQIFVVRRADRPSEETIIDLYNC